MLHRLAHAAAASLFMAALLAPASDSAADPARGRGWIGIAMGAVVDGVAGVPVEHVIHGSPAERGGVHANDRILQVAGVVVANSRDVVRLLGARGSGESVTIKVARGSETRDISCLLAEYPSMEAILRMDRVGSPAPEWRDLEAGSGFPPSVAALRGHVVLVDFWATWCGPCRELAPTLSGWQSRYGAQGLTVVGITTDPREAAATFKERLDLHYSMASDPHATTSLAYGVSALPTLFVVDKAGVVRDLSVGTGPDEDRRIEALVQSLLAENPAAP